jgi:hypothetical protein
MSILQNFLELNKQGLNTISTYIYEQFDPKLAFFDPARAQPDLVLSGSRLAWPGGAGHAWSASQARGFARHGPKFSGGPVLAHCRPWPAKSPRSHSPKNPIHNSLPTSSHAAFAHRKFVTRLSHVAHRATPHFPLLPRSVLARCSIRTSSHRSCHNV